MASTVIIGLTPVEVGKMDASATYRLLTCVHTRYRQPRKSSAQKVTCQKPGSKSGGTRKGKGLLSRRSPDSNDRRSLGEGCHAHDILNRRASGPTAQKQHYQGASFNLSNARVALAAELPVPYHTSRRCSLIERLARQIHCPPQQGN